MKILHVITSLRTGGAERLMVDLLPLLAQKGHQVHLLLFDGTRTPFFEMLESKGITIYSLGKGEQAMHNPLLIFKLRKFLKGYDVVHTHNTPCQLLVALVSYNTPIKFVTTEHSTNNRRRSWSWYRPIDRWMYSRYHHIICVSRDAETLLCKSLDSEMLHQRISTIENGVNIEAIQQAEPNAELLQQHAQHKRIMMISAFRVGKQQEVLIRAMQQLPYSYHLFLVGEGERQNECKALTEQLYLSERVHFMGLRMDIPSLLKTADVLVLSSHYEGLSLSSIEGMASGAPFVASKVPGLTEIVEGYGVLFAEENYAELAEIITEMCCNEESRAKVVESCLQRASQFDIKTMANKYEQVYKEMCL